MWKRLRLALVAALAFVGTWAAYKSSLPPTERQQLKADFEEVAVRRPRFAPLVKFVCPTCDVPIQCSLLGWETHPTKGTQYPRVCRYGRLYAVGEGGAQACTHSIDPWPCNGGKSWPARVQALIDVGDKKAILKILKRAARRRGGQ